MCEKCDNLMESEDYNGYVACPEGDYYKKAFKLQVIQAKICMLKVEGKSLERAASGKGAYTDYFRRRYYLAYCGVNGIDRRIAYFFLDVYKKEYFDRKPEWDRTSATIEDIDAKDVIALSYPA